MVRSGKSFREVSRYFGYSVGAIHKWCTKAPFPGVFIIPTESSRPNHHPYEIPIEIVKKIVGLRLESGGRCSEVIHQMALNEGINISLSTVKRILGRAGMIKRKSPWKRMHPHMDRPQVLKEGDLVQIDTIHIMQNQRDKIYIYTLLDVFSRWAHALATERINTHRSLNFVQQATKESSFQFICIQSDNGSEFSQTFTQRLKITHRHSRVRKPNDNAHLERFNRTIQQEFLSKLPVDVSTINKHMPEYLKYYNEERLHLGIGLRTPREILSKCSQAID
jgi:transposase InsO family protein